MSKLDTEANPCFSSTGFQIMLYISIYRFYLTFNRSFEVNDGDKTIRTASNHKDFANMCHFLRKTCQHQHSFYIWKLTSIYIGSKTI